MITRVETIILSAAAAAAASACATASAPTSGETVPLVRLAADAERWRGQEVRTCGPNFRRDPDRDEWRLSVPRAVGNHPAIIRVLGCAGSAPARDSHGCVSGRIARRDGSIEPTPEGQPVTVSSAIVSYDWYLHAQCRTPRGG